ncbi:Si-specific NAD(P)(+) transhydrogenase [Thiohalobacter sp. IOR34]|uniref:Si-specific NAD(P)(+) transhydrogenase n=1 Tax=Thiohalobacter sp. IOR34 TaxID=3057176 RepID=UPI0025B09808|nr:Si-specific NAD(P)(+) transhydrogenase [Thiohalobacter sp. IOR34]WJW75246.1 Si-specific NAD(P)(+) transhydrogenase [Thiohalobacter sp. IOR34]
MQHFDFLVIGSGPAGQRAAIQAAKLGKNAAIIERRPVVGGVSVHTGTIPSKTLREAVLYLTGWDQRGVYGRSYRLKDKLDIDDLMKRLDITLNHEIEVMEHQLMRNGVTVIEGSASFVDPHRVRIEKPDGTFEEYTADKFLLAVGSRPARPEGIPFDNETILDSDGILNLKRIPRSMIVVGAGVIGMEYASIFSTMDVKITLIDGRPTLLNFMDREIVDELVHSLRERGVVLRLGEKVAQVERTESGSVTCRLESGKQLRADTILFAAGRIGCTYTLGLENAGLETDERRRLAVNEHFQTAVPHIYAAGDIIGFPALASTSMEQGRLAACHAMGTAACTTQEFFPFGIYAVPEMSMIGATEQELTEKQIPYETGVARLRETARGQIMGLQEGMLKLLVSLDDRRLLGVHIIGEGATELIHIGQAVLSLGGSLDYFLENVFNYPTLAEAYKVAALDAWNRLTL